MQKLTKKPFKIHTLVVRTERIFFFILVYSRSIQFFSTTYSCLAPICVNQKLGQTDRMGHFTLLLWKIRATIDINKQQKFWRTQNMRKQLQIICQRLKLLGMILRRDRVLVITLRTFNLCWAFEQHASSQICVPKEPQSTLGML